MIGALALSNRRILLLLLGDPFFVISVVVDADADANADSDADSAHDCFEDDGHDRRRVLCPFPPLVPVHNRADADDDLDVHVSSVQIDRDHLSADNPPDHDHDLEIQTADDWIVAAAPQQALVPPSPHIRPRSRIAAALHSAELARMVLRIVRPPNRNRNLPILLHSSLFFVLKYGFLKLNLFQN